MNGFQVLFERAAGGRSQPAVNRVDRTAQRQPMCFLAGGISLVLGNDPNENTQTNRTTCSHYAYASRPAELGPPNSGRRAQQAGNAIKMALPRRAAGVVSPTTARPFRVAQSSHATDCYRRRRPNHSDFEHEEINIHHVSQSSQSFLL